MTHRLARRASLATFERTQETGRELMGVPTVHIHISGAGSGVETQNDYIIKQCQRGSAGPQKLFPRDGQSKLKTYLQLLDVLDALAVPHPDLFRPSVFISSAVGRRPPRGSPKKDCSFSARGPQSKGSPDSTLLSRATCCVGGLHIEHMRARPFESTRAPSPCE